MTTTYEIKTSEISYNQGHYIIISDNPHLTDDELLELVSSGKAEFVDVDYSSMGGSEILEVAEVVVDGAPRNQQPDGRLLAADLYPPPAGWFADWYDEDEE